MAQWRKDLEQMPESHPIQDVIPDWMQQNLEAPGERPLPDWVRENLESSGPREQSQRKLESGIAIGELEGVSDGVLERYDVPEAMEEWHVQEEPVS